MKKTIIAALIFVPSALLSSCAVTTGAAVAPGYSGVYSTGYYGYRPYWSTYSGGWGWGNVGYWGGYRGYRGWGWNRGWAHRGWGGRGWGGRGWGGHGFHGGFHGGHHR